MRKPRNNRRLGIESLENRVVFAEDLVMIDVDQLIQWHVIPQDSEFAIEHRNTSVPISRDRLALIGEGEWYRNAADASMTAQQIAASTENLPPISPSLDTSIALHKAISNSNHSTESSVAAHLAKEASALEAATSTMELDALGSTPLSNVASLAMDTITVATEKAANRSLERVSASSVEFDMQFLDEVSKIQAARPSVSTVSTADPNVSKNLSDIARGLDDAFGSSENRRRTDGIRSPRSSHGTRFEKQQGGSMFEDGRKDLFAESIYAISLPDADHGPAAPSWSLLFGVVYTASPFTDHVEDSKMADVRRAVLEIVAESERTDMSAPDMPAPELSATYSSNAWKATTIVAAALTAAFYRNKRQQDQVPSLLSRIRKQRLHFKGPRRKTGFYFYQ